MAALSQTDVRTGWGGGAVRGCAAEFEAVRYPVLVVGGEHGMGTRAGAEMRVRQPRATYVEVAGAGHVVHADAPAEFRAAVEPFVRAHLPA